MTKIKNTNIEKMDKNNPLFGDIFLKFILHFCSVLWQIRFFVEQHKLSVKEMR